MALLYLLLISSAFVAKLWAIPVGQEQVCDCSGKMATVQVCGTDKFTYHNVCIMKEAQKTSPPLGRRCLGPCPCVKRSAPSFCTKRASGDRTLGYHVSDFDGNLKPEYIIDLLGIEHAPYGESHLQNIIAGALGKDYLERAGEPSLFSPVCLTNGTTVPHMKDAACAISLSEDAELGVRCLGDCSECAAEPPCPVSKKTIFGVGPVHE